MMFSIITITRNDLSGLQATHTSIQSQTCTDYEWIVVDGASNDGTAQWLKTHAPDAISEPDHGLYDAMNKGLARATGDYIIFMNGGDQFADDNVLSNLSQLISMASTPPGFIYGDALETRPDGQMAYKAARPFIKVDLGMFTHHQAMVYARKVIGDMRYDTRYTIAADYKLTLQTLGATRAIYYVPAPFCIFANGGLSQTRTALGRREQFDIRRELGVVGPIRNRAIKTLQMINMGVRRICPPLYWALKARRDNTAIRR